MKPFAYARARGVEEALALKGAHGDARWLAGGQTLLAAMRLGLNEPEALVDLQALPELQGIAVGAVLSIGAMVTHDQVARSTAVRAWAPMLAYLAGGIGDQQVRNVGTIGGSLANNDPSACWPAGALALAAQMVTNQRRLAADDFFQGLFSTALAEDELLVRIEFAPVRRAAYLKFAHPASRFALVGVAIADTRAGVRVAVTGLGHGVRRVAQAEERLTHNFSVAALQGGAIEEAESFSDIHASAAYRVHLAWVLITRCVAQMTSGPSNT